MKQVKAAVIQAASVLFDKQLTVEKACKLIEEAGKSNSQLILLPEAFVPAYPRGFSFGMVVGSRSEAGRDLWRRYWENSVDVPGPETDLLGKAAKKANAYVCIGVIERDQYASKGTLYCSMLYFDPKGKLMGIHRKLKPTAAERLIWGEGDGSTLPVFQTGIGNLGGLICWENYMPLARMAIYGQGVEIYLAPTADSRETWQSTIRHIACEGRCFVLGCNQFVTKDMYPSDLETIDELHSQPEIMCNGGSAIVSPLGDVIAGPLWGQEGILYADLDFSLIVKSKLDFDVTGHYARSDIFKLKVKTKKRRSVTYK